MLQFQELPAAHGDRLRGYYRNCDYRLCEYSLGVLVLTGGFLAVDVYTAFQEHRAVSDVRTFQPDHLARAQPCGNFEPVSVDEQLVRRLASVLGGINVEKFPQVVRLQD